MNLVRIPFIPITNQLQVVYCEKLYELIILYNDLVYSLHILVSVMCAYYFHYYKFYIYNCVCVR